MRYETSDCRSRRKVNIEDLSWRVSVVENRLVFASLTEELFTDGLIILVR